MDQLLSCGEVAASLEGWSSVCQFVCYLSVYLSVCLLVSFACSSVCLCLRGESVFVV